LESWYLCNDENISLTLKKERNKKELRLLSRVSYWFTQYSRFHLTGSPGCGRSVVFLFSFLQPKKKKRRKKMTVLFHIFVVEEIAPRMRVCFKNKTKKVIQKVIFIR